MPIVYIPPLLRDVTGGQPSLRVDGATVRQVIDNLERAWPGIREKLMDRDRLRPNISVAVDGEVSPLGLLERVEPASEIHFVAAISGGRYDPFARGPFSVDVRTIQARDTARDRVFPCEVWYPAAHSGTHPLIIFSHASSGGRRQSTFLCTHLSSHGYVVAAPDHSELVAPELARREDEGCEQRAARAQAWIENRVPDVRFLRDHLLATWDSEARLDPTRVGIVGHSFGGWTALAAPEVEQRIGAIVALAPGGASRPKPGIIPARLTFAWGRDVPTLYLVAENDVCLPLDGMYELFERTPGTRRMVVLRRADHMHFMDDVEKKHEAVRAMAFPGEAAWIPKEMRPIAELCSGEQAHLFVRGLTLCHLDAVLRRQEEAQRFWLGDLEAELAARGIEAFVHRR